MTRGGCSRCPSPGGSRLRRVKPVSCLREEHTLRGVRRGLGAHGQSLLSSPRSTRFPVLPARSLRHADPAVRDASAEPRYPGEASRSPGRDPGPRASPRRPLPLSHTASPSCEGDGSPGAPSPRPTRSLASGSARGGRQCISGSSCAVTGASAENALENLSLGWSPKRARRCGCRRSGKAPKTDSEVRGPLESLNPTTQGRHYGVASIFAERTCCSFLITLGRAQSSGFPVYPWFLSRLSCWHRFYLSSDPGHWDNQLAECVSSRGSALFKFGLKSLRGKREPQGGSFSPPWRPESETRAWAAPVPSAPRPS